MRRILATLALLAVSLPAWAGYTCDASNDRMVGVFATGTYGLPIVLATYAKYANHPSANNHYMSLGNSAASNNDALSFRAASTDDVFNGRSQNSGGTAATASSPAVVTDNTWFPIVVTFDASNSRTIYVNTFANSANSTTSNAITSALDDIKICETLQGAEDAGVSLAEMVIWDSAVSDADITLYMTAQTVPTLPTGPTLGTPTDSTLPVTFTSDYTGTVKGTACANGTAGNVAETKAGQCSGGGAAAATITEAVVKDVADGATFTGLAASTTYDLSFVITRSNVIPTVDAANQIGYWPLSTSNATQANDGVDTGGDLTVTGAVHTSDHPALTPDSAVESIADATTGASASGEFTVNPTVTAQDTNDYTLSGTTGALATVSVVACPKDTAAPDIAEVGAGDCDGGVSSVASATDSWNGADSLTLGGALTYPVHDLYATDDTNLVTLADEFLDVPAGKQRIDAGLASVHATSPYFGQGVAAGDIPTCDTVTDPSGYAISDETDGTISYAAGGDTSRQLIECSVYDLSNPQMLDFLFVYNNGSPFSIDEWILEDALFAINTDPGVDIEVDYVSDPELDDLTWAVTAGAMPDDWVLSAATGIISDGTPGACGDFTFDITGTDVYGATIVLPSVVTIGPLVPDVVTGGVSVAAAVATIEGTCTLTATAGTSRYSATVALGDVIETDPVADTLVEPDAEVTYVESLGPPPPGGGFYADFFPFNDFSLH